MAALRSLLNCAHLHAHTRLTLKEWQGSQSKPKSEAARVAAICELLDRGYGKAGQAPITENEVNPSDLTAEELRKELLAEFAAPFPDLRIVTSKPPNSLAESKVRRLSWIAPHDACDVD